MKLLPVGYRESPSLRLARPITLGELSIPEPGLLDATCTTESPCPLARRGFGEGAPQGIPCVPDAAAATQLDKQTFAPIGEFAAEVADGSWGFSGFRLATWIGLPRRSVGPPS